jgi:1,4-dihydroxy-2-naphthoate octaprenyltransferase
MKINNLAKGLLIEIRPLPTIAAITAGLIGFLLSKPSTLPLTQVLLFSTAVFIIMLTVHIHDTYVDYYIRGEDKVYDFGLLDSSNNLISIRQMKIILTITSTAYFFIIALLTLRGGAVFAVLATLGWITGLLYTPYLDKNPILSSFSYPFGMLLTIIGAAYLIQQTFKPAILLYATALMLSLGGAKIVEDLIDMAHDPDFGKATVATRLGFNKAKKIGYTTVFVGLALLALASLTSLIPPFIMIGILIGGAVAAFSYHLPPIRGVYILVAGLYVVMLVTLLPL